MEKTIFLNRRFFFSIILILISFSNLFAQSEKSELTKIEELKSSPDFKPQNPEYIDLIIELAKKKVRTNPDSTAILLKEGYAMSLETKYRAGESKALSTYGYVYFEKGEIDKAYDYNMKALDVANTHNLVKEKLIALNNMGLDFLLQGNEASAVTKFLEALAVAEEAEDIEMMVRLNVNIANLYSENEDYETSLTFLEIARKLNVEHENEQILAYTLLNMASEYSQIGNIGEADRMVNKCITFFEKENIIDWLSHAYEQKGSIVLKQNKPKEALNWYLKSEKLCDEINFSLGYTMVYNGLAECYLRLENLDNAEQYGLKGLHISTELKNASSIKTANLILSKVYYQKRNYKKAYEYKDAYINLYEKGSVKKFKKGLGVLRSKIQFENQKNLLIEEQEKAITKQKNYVYLAIASLFIVSLFLILLYRTNKIQKKYTQNLQEKQDILMTREAELSESNNTKDKLFSIIAHDLKGPINSFYSLMKISSTESISKKDYDNLIPKALTNIQGVSELLNNLLVWAKTQMDGIILKQENIDINDVAEMTILVLSPLADKKEISIKNTIPENTISNSDKNHLRIILRNLISNAIKFTNNNGNIIIGVKKLNSDLQLNVTDNGLGMNAETRAMLFKAPHMKSTYGTNQEKGTGLGLSICKEMVESNGGKIWISSVQNKGTTIYFTVPAELESNV